MDIEKYKEMLAGYGINTPVRLAAFLAQCDHESGGFKRLVENLNYSAERLCQVWPNRFNPKNTGIYAGHPERIANKVYSDRLGNGPESSGDGWRYRGRGYIQLTGKGNYSAFASYKGMTLDEVITFLGTEDGALESAAWFWKTHSLNVYADAGNIRELTRRINGGFNGLTQRMALYEKYLQAVS